jgi:Ni,Fe-hydrogenase maturation factor
VDALDGGKRPGELFEPPLEELSLEKAEDFNIHMTPASNMLLKLRKMGVEIRILACKGLAGANKARPFERGRGGVGAGGPAGAGNGRRNP